MLDKKQILAIFLFEFKMDHKAVETNCNIHNAFGSGIADECTMVQDVLQRSWEPWTWGTHYWSLEVDNNNWEPLLKVILLQLHEKLPKNSMSTILWSFGIWSKLEMWKSSVNGCLLSWPKKKKKKNVVLKCHLLLFYTRVNHFSIGLWWEEKWIVYDNQWQPA